MIYKGYAEKAAGCNSSFRESNFNRLLTQGMDLLYKFMKYISAILNN